MTARRLWIIVAVLAILTPIGLWLPERLGAGDAWGEWGAEDLVERIGFIPRGMARIAQLWKAPAPDYGPTGWEERPLYARGAAYVVSALVGIAVCGLAVWLLGRWLAKREESGAP